MSKKLLTRTCKFLRSDATRLSPEAIEEIRNAQNNIPDARRIMCKKHHIGATTYQKIIDNQRSPEPTEEWRRILESVSVSDRISENNQESLQLTKGESSLVEKNRIVNSFKDDTSRRESDLNKLLNITGNIVTHPIFSL
ncbi:6714_t:CDS:2 [Gigaspora margarita]|uniref:6714_t:CDS:1 n=1 Tax=Gigaspora margarita TaxID=4874 RepID=A0ABN7W6U0_GIGMA|nr:6714_t:CDS:2 [Gigaspora margarita]